MKVVLAIDSFKGCASSQELSAWIEEGIKEVYTEADVHSCYIADGGEGMLSALMQNVKGKIVTCKVHVRFGMACDRRSPYRYRCILRR